MPSADAGAVHSSASQNLHPRPKGDKFSEWFGEHSKLARRVRGSMKGSENIGVCSKNIVIVFGATLKRRMRGREMDKKRAAMSHTLAAMFWTFIWRCLNVMWHQHQIYSWIDNN